MPDYSRTIIPVFAAANGVVRSVSEDGIVIDYENGLVTRWFHLTPEVVEGDHVVKGQQIGTGR